MTTSALSERKDKSFTCEVVLADGTRSRSFIDKDHTREACSKPARSSSTNTLEHGKMAAIVQSFNHEIVAYDIVSSLAQQAPALKHVLVYDDGSTDGSPHAYQDALSHYENTLLGNVTHSPNLHEICNYNLGMEHLHHNHPEVDYYALMQDDDVLLGPNSWALRAMQLMDDFPKVCILGGYIGWYHFNGRKNLKGSEFEFEYYVGEHSYNPGKHAKVRHTCHDDYPFQFVMGITSSPMIVRRACYEEIGPLSELYTERGEPGIMFDMEYSARAWAHDWQVGLFSTNYTHSVGGHGTMANPERQAKRDRAVARGNNYVRKHYRSVACHYTSLERDDLKTSQIVW